MGYILQPKIKVELSHLGTDAAGNAFFVEIRNPRVLPFERKMELATHAQEMKDDMKQGAQGVKAAIQGFIVAWNLIDIDTEQPVSHTADNALDRVPSEVVEAILKEFEKLNPQQDDATKNS